MIKPIQPSESKNFVASTESTSLSPPINKKTAQAAKGSFSFLAFIFSPFRELGKWLHKTFTIKGGFTSHLGKEADYWETLLSCSTPKDFWIDNPLHWKEYSAKQTKKMHSRDAFERSVIKIATALEGGIASQQNPQLIAKGYDNAGNAYIIKQIASEAAEASDTKTYVLIYADTAIRPAFHTFKFKIKYEVNPTRNREPADLTFIDSQGKPISRFHLQFELEVQAKEKASREAVLQELSKLSWESTQEDWKLATG